MSYHEGSNWQARKEDEGKPLYGEEPTIYDKNDLAHRHLDKICALCGARSGLHSHMNQRCPLKGAEETSADHTEYRDTVFTPAKSQPQQSFSREEVVKLLSENRIETIKSTSPQYYEEVYKPLFEESDKEELKKWLDQKLNTH